MNFSPVSLEPINIITRNALKLGYADDDCDNDDDDERRYFIYLILDTVYLKILLRSVFSVCVCVFFPTINFS